MFEMKKWQILSYISLEMAAHVASPTVLTNLEYGVAGVSRQKFEVVLSNRGSKHEA
jgi:hypothetical protein